MKRETHQAWVMGLMVRVTRVYLGAVVCIAQTCA